MLECKQGNVNGRRTDGQMDGGCQPGCYSVNEVKYGIFSNSRLGSNLIHNPAHPRSYDHIHFDQVCC